ncbi:hypothetical protein [Salinivirga cyanobacteriivorans]
MENNANRHRNRLIIVILLIFTAASTNAQKQNLEKNDTSTASLYSHINYTFSVNTSRILQTNDTLPNFGYDYGLGGGLENEFFFNQKMSGLAGLNLNFYRSSMKSSANMYRVLALNARIAGKYYITHRMAAYLGVSSFYTVTQQLKTSYLDEKWKNEDYIDKFQFGGIAGLDFYLYDWSTIRTTVSVHQQAVAFEMALIITPDYF